jgi:hypothetical protein
MMFVIFSRSKRLAFSISVQRSTSLSGPKRPTFKDLLLLSLDQGVAKRARLVVVHHGPSLKYLLFVQPAVGGLPLLVEYAVKLGKGSVHYSYIKFIPAAFAERTFGVLGFWGDRKSVL